MFQKVGQNQRPSAKVYSTRGDTRNLCVAQYQPHPLPGKYSSVPEFPTNVWKPAASLPPLTRLTGPLFFPGGFATKIFVTGLENFPFQHSRWKFFKYAGVFRIVGHGLHCSGFFLGFYMLCHSTVPTFLVPIPNFLKFLSSRQWCKYDVNLHPVD